MIFAAIADWADAKEYPVEFMCTELGVSVSGYYAWRTRPVSAHAHTDEKLLRLIRSLFDRLKGNPGVRRMHAELASLGPFPVRWRVGHIPRVPDNEGNRRWDRHGGRSRRSTKRQR